MASEKQKPRRIRVMHASNQLGLGGTEKAIQLFLENLDKTVFDASACGLLKGGERGEILKKKGFEVFEAAGDCEAFKKRLEHGKIDIIHFHRAGWPNEKEHEFMRAALAAKVPVMMETNIFGGVDQTTVGTRFDHRLFPSKMAALRWCKWTGTSVEKFWEKNKVLYNPINTGFFTRANALGKAKARKAFGLLENDFVIGRLSRRDMSKWEDMPIQAMSMLSEKIPNAKFLIANAPQEAIDKIKKSPQAGRFIFIFAIPEERLGAFYAALDVFAYSSRIGESFGYVIAEAMATARPVVVNSTPLWDNAQIELVDNNNTGFVANSAKAMADAILKLYSNPSIAGKMGERAQQKAQKQYDEKQQTLMLSKIYVDLLKTKGIELPKQARKFNSIELVPSKKELALFGKEYSERLFDYCGKPDYGYEIEAHAFDRLNNRQFHRYAKGILRYSKLRKV